LSAPLLVDIVFEGFRFRESAQNSNYLCNGREQDETGTAKEGSRFDSVQ